MAGNGVEHEIAIGRGDTRIPRVTVTETMLATDGMIDAVEMVEGERARNIEDPMNTAMMIRITETDGGNHDVVQRINPKKGLLREIKGIVNVKVIGVVTVTMGDAEIDLGVGTMIDGGNGVGRQLSTLLLHTERIEIALIHIGMIEVALIHLSGLMTNLRFDRISQRSHVRIRKRDS